MCMREFCGLDTPLHDDVYNYPITSALNDNAERLMTEALIVNRKIVSADYVCSVCVFWAWYHVL